MNRSYGTALTLSLVITAVACQANRAQSPNDSVRGLSMAATVSPTPEVVNPAFVVTADQVRKAFDDAELRGENGQGIGVGEEQSTNILAQNPLGGTETLQFRILFLTPVDQAMANGYSFGQVAKHRTPADRKDYEDRSVTTITKNSNQVVFRVFLQQPKNADATIPIIHFKLLDKNGERIDPITEPNSYVASPKDLIGTVALAEEGQPFTFPVFSGSSPNLTSQMKKLALIIVVDDQDRTLEYHLK